MAPNSGSSGIQEFSFRTRQRDWDALKKSPDQLLPMVIIGGGIAGAGLLRELSLRGVTNVYLFEKNDFASGTSGASSKLIHAGIRYLEQAWIHLKQLRLRQAWQNLRFVIQASGERKVLSRLAPGLIKPKPIFLVLSKLDPRSRMSVIAGVSVYYLMQFLQWQFFPPPTFYLSRKKIETLRGELNVDRVKAVLVFWDSETDDARLVIENLQSAALQGAHALNYVELISFERGEGCVSLALKNKESDEVLLCKTKLLINATGPFIDEIREREKGQRFPMKALLDRVAGSHIDVYPALTENSYYVSVEDNRLVFVLRRDEDGLIYTRIGTTERPLLSDEPSDSPQPTQPELSYLRNLVNAYFPKATFNELTVIRTDAGIRPLRAQAGLTTFLKSREHDVVEDNGVIHVVGVKLTDFRRVAKEIADKLRIAKTRSPDSRFIRPKLVSRIYAEQSMEQLVNQTMTLHWDDFVLRRAGLRPLLERRQKPELFKKEFDRLADCLGWNTERRDKEWKRSQL